METYIEFREKKYKHLILTISPFSPFNEVLKILNSVRIPWSKIRIDQLFYAVLELINNSIRAQKEKDCHDKIRLEIRIEGTWLKLKLQDAGGGFDTARLPYDINAAIQDISLNQPSFLAYREKHQYKRFGMGLFITKKTFTIFRLTFYNEEDQPVDWIPEGKNTHIKGTIIDLGIDLVEKNEGRKQTR